MTEVQKYHGNTAKARKPKPSANDARAMIPRKAYVEDAQDVAEGGAVAIVDVPPRAPSPPPLPMPVGEIEYSNAAAPASINVFDFLVDETSSPAKYAAPATQLLPSARDMPTPRMRERPHDSYHSRGSRRNSEHDPHYMEQGFSYGASPIAHESGIKRYDSSLDLALEPANYTTPAPGRGSISMSDARSYYEDGSTGRRKSTNKRKRNNVEELNLARHGPLEYMEGDQVMTDAPPLLHSGLTGGLTRLLTRPDFPPSPDYSGGDGDNGEPTPLAPLKRSKHSKSSTRSATDRERDRGEYKPERRIVKVIKESARKSSSESQQSGQSQSHTLGGEHTIIRHSRRRHKHHSAEPGEHRERRERHRSRKDREGSEQRQHQSRRRRRRHSSSSPHRNGNSNGNKPLKAIEYHHSHHGRSSRSPSNSQNGPGGHAENQQLILRKTAITASAHVSSRPTLDAAAFAQLFLSFVTKGPDSEKGYSINKALKRFHRELGAAGSAGAGVAGAGSDVNEGAAGTGAGDGNGGGNGGAPGSGSGSGSARKADEEKELFKALRLKRNDRGEIVVFM